MIIHNPILTGSFTFNGTDVSSVTGSSNYSASFASSIGSLNSATSSLNSFSASVNTFTASAATTASNTFVGNQVVSGSLTVSSSITTPGTLTAQTLVVQTITSSVDFVTGSTRFGSLSSNTHVFTGSMSVSGSAVFSGSVKSSNLFLGNNQYLAARNAANTADRTLIAFNSSNAIQIGQDTDITSVSIGVSSANLTISSTGAATFSSTITAASTGGSGLRIYGAAGTNQWDMYLNSTNLRFSDNTGTGNFVVDRRISAGGSMLLGEVQGSYSLVETTAGNGIWLRPGGTASPGGLFVSSGSNNVGIGTTSPNNLLELNAGSTSKGIQVYGSSSPFVQVQATNNPVVIKLAADDSGGYVQVTTNHLLAFYTNNTERMRITSGGTIGFTATPAAQSGGALAGSVEVGGILRIQGGGGRYFTSGDGLEISKSGMYSYNRSTSTYNTFGINDTISVIGGGGGTTFTANDGITLKNTANQYRQIYHYNSNGGDLYFWNGTNQAYLGFAGVWTNASDITIKKDITDIKYGLSDLMNLLPRSYKMKEGDLEQIGFIAQEIEEIIPEVVNTDHLGMKGLSYGNLLAVAVKAIQELKSENDSLKLRIEALENK